MPRNLYWAKSCRQRITSECFQGVPYDVFPRIPVFPYSRVNNSMTWCRGIHTERRVSTRGLARVWSESPMAFFYLFLYSRISRVNSVTWCPGIHIERRFAARGLASVSSESLMAFFFFSPYWRRSAFTAPGSPLVKPGRLSAGCAGLPWPRSCSCCCSDGQSVSRGDLIYLR